MLQPIQITQLQNFQRPTYLVKEAANKRFSTAYTAKGARVTTAFLCHSHNDQALVEKLSEFFAAAGIDLYIDWKDHTMPASPNRETAEKIQRKICELDLFLYLATPNSNNSKWCPWEIGYGDYAKGKDKVIIIPTRNANVTSGQEYLSLYPSIQIENGKLYRTNPMTGSTTPWTV